MRKKTADEILQERRDKFIALVKSDSKANAAEVRKYFDEIVAANPTKDELCMWLYANFLEKNGDADGAKKLRADVASHHETCRENVLTAVHYASDADEEGVFTRAICGELIATIELRSDGNEMKPVAEPRRPSSRVFAEITCNDCKSALRQTTLVNAPEQPEQ